LGLTCLLSAAACLVTNDVEYKVVNSPPSVVPVSPNQFTYVPRDSDPDCAMSAGKSFMQFDVTIYDEDVDQNLTVRVVVDDKFHSFVDVPPASGAAAQRSLPNVLCIDTAVFRKPCTKVEVLVTSAFDGNIADVKKPLIPGDLGHTSWFVLGGSRDTPDANPSDCEVLFDAGLP
jgi:hypothetical protein